MSTQINDEGCEQGSDGPAQNNWLCVMCKMQQEYTAENNLGRQGFTVYFPTAPNKSRRQGRVTTDIKAMFPGYLFIEADLEHQDLSVIRSTLGCIAFLRHGVRPVLVPNQVLASIKEAEDVLHGRFAINQGFTPGNKYALMEQGFNGHTATFLALDGKDRAKVLVTLLNSEREVRIPISSLGQQLS